MPILISDEELRRTIDAAQEYGSHTKAAEVLGIDRRTVGDRIKLAARRGIAPGHWENGVAPGYKMGKVTIHRNEDGVIKNTWERQHPDEIEIMRAGKALMEALLKDIPRADPVPLPHVNFLQDVLSLYTFTDYHYGMYANALQGGAAWNLTIADQVAMAVLDHQSSGSRRAGTAILNIQGDFFHQDSLLSITPTHGHVVDSAGRFEEIVDGALVLVRKMVSFLLTKHEKVILLICEGNHDIITSMMIRKGFKMFYENDPRVEVIDSMIPYYMIEWGKQGLGFHHGHLRKNESLPALFAAQFREAWGRCPKFTIHTGHRHHKEVKDYPGCEVFQHPTLTARDSHAARGGWWAERRSFRIDYHKQFGEAGCLTTTPEMLGFV